MQSLGLISVQNLTRNQGNQWKLIAIAHSKFLVLCSKLGAFYCFRLNPTGYKLFESCLGEKSHNKENIIKLLDIYQEKKEEEEYKVLISNSGSWSGWIYFTRLYRWADVYTWCTPILGSQLVQVLVSSKWKFVMRVIINLVFFYLKFNYFSIRLVDVTIYK